MDAQGVYEKLKAKGRAVTLRVTSTTDADPGSGDAGTETTTDYATYALELQATAVQRSQWAAVYGADVAVKTRSFMVAALGIPVGGSLQQLPELSAAMQIIDSDGAALSILAPGPMKPGSELYYYEVTARGA